MKKTIAILIGVALIALLPACNQTEYDVSSPTDISSPVESVPSEMSDTSEVISSGESIPEEVSSDESTAEESSAEESSAEEVSTAVKPQHNYVCNLSDFTYERDKYGDWFILKYNGHDEYVEVPGFIKTEGEDDGGRGKQHVEGIHPDAFAGCDFIKGIKLDIGIRSFGISANYSRDEYIPDPDRDIRDGFCSCTSIEELILPERGLRYCGYICGTNITELIIPEGPLGGPGWGWLSNNKKLKRVVYEGSNFNLDLHELSGCIALEEVILPSNCEWVPRGAINYDITTLKELFLPDNYSYTPMFLPKNVVYYVMEGSKAEKTLKEYNADDMFDPVQYKVLRLVVVEEHLDGNN